MALVWTQKQCERNKNKKNKNRKEMREQKKNPSKYRTFQTNTNGVYAIRPYQKSYERKTESEK